MTGEENFEQDSHLKKLPRSMLLPYARAVDRYHPERRYSSALEMIRVLEGQLEVELVPKEALPVVPPSLSQAFLDLTAATNVNPGKMMRLLKRNPSEFDKLLRSVKSEVLKKYI